MDITKQIAEELQIKPWQVEAVVKLIPPPDGDDEAPLKALIFDSYYDNYKGVILFVRIKDGSVKAGDVIKGCLSDKTYEVTEVGAFSPQLQPKEILLAGEVGYIAASIKSIEDIAVGDTAIKKSNRSSSAASIPSTEASSSTSKTPS